MNCYFTFQKLSKFSKTCFTTTKDTALAPFNLVHPVYTTKSWDEFDNGCSLMHCCARAAIERL